jgi:hypothetical protein
VELLTAGNLEVDDVPRLHGCLKYKLPARKTKRPLWGVLDFQDSFRALGGHFNNDDFGLRLAELHGFSL